MRLEYGFLLEKAAYFNEHSDPNERKNFLLDNNIDLLLHKNLNNKNLRTLIRLKRFEKFLIRHKLPKYFEFAKWILIDFMRGKIRKFACTYIYIGLQGEGKTISMVAHIERVKMQHNNDVLVATNFDYVDEDYPIDDWIDIIKFVIKAHKLKKKCLVAIDEIQNLWDSADWQHFPKAMSILLSFYRKYNLQFLCSSQIYDRVPKKIRDISKYVVICKNVGDFDRLFRNYYYPKKQYDDVFNGKMKIAKADFIREFVADDEMYSRYDTLQIVENIVSDAQKEKDKRQEAIDVLFPVNKPGDAELAEASGA